MLRTVSGDDHEALRETTCDFIMLIIAKNTGH